MLVFTRWSGMEFKSLNFYGYLKSFAFRHQKSYFLCLLNPLSGGSGSRRVDPMMPKGVSLTDSLIYRFCSNCILVSSTEALHTWSWGHLFIGPGLKYTSCN